MGNITQKHIEQAARHTDAHTAIGNQRHRNAHARQTRTGLEPHELGARTQWKQPAATKTHTGNLSGDGGGGRDDDDDNDDVDEGSSSGHWKLAPCLCSAHKRLPFIPLWPNSLFTLLLRLKSKLKPTQIII